MRIFGFIFVAALVVWQLISGFTIGVIGIPNVFEIHFTPPAPTYCMFPDPAGSDRFGGADYNNGAVMKDFQACQASCVGETDCKAVSWHTISRQCWMKKDVPLRRPSPEFISAVKDSCK